jgi:hypothetical protein
MRKHHTWIWVIIACVIVIYGIAFIIDLQNQTPDSSHAELQIAPVVRRVMVVDLDNNGHVDQQGILSGDDPLLGLKVPSNNPDQTAIEYVDSFAHLGDIDANGDGHLDSADSIYTSLVLVYFDQTGKPVRLVPLADAGIRAINWRTHIPAALLRLSKKFMAEQRNIIMSDGTKRKLRIIPLNDNVILNSQ